MDVSMSELRHRISILRPVTETDDEGNILAQTTQEIAKAWALVLPFAAKISDGYAEKVQEVDYLSADVSSLRQSVRDLRQQPKEILLSCVLHRRAVWWMQECPH